MRFVITGFPMAPSANALYAGGRFNGKSRRWKSDEYHSFLSRAQTWANKNQKTIQLIKDAADKAAQFGFFLRVDTYFCFKKDQLWAKAHKGYLKRSGEEVPPKPDRPKVLDATNRVKATHDFLASMIGRDDLNFWAGLCEKIETEENQEPEVVFVITQHKTRTYSDLLSELYPNGMPEKVPMLPVPNLRISAEKKYD